MNKHTKIILLLILLVGLSLLLYSAISIRWNRYHQCQAVASYADLVAQLDDGRYDAIWQSAWEYNLALLKQTDRYEEQSADYKSQLVVAGSDVMGYISIPELEVMMPILHGTSDAVLKNAIGHLQWSSLPVGGESSHCVLLGSTRLLVDLDQMKIGDVFLLYILDEVLSYEVDQIRAVKPDELEALEIVEGENYCTLVACTTYGDNGYRFLVRGRRVVP